MVPSLFTIVGLSPEAVGPVPLLSTPLRKNCWAHVDAVWHGTSTDMTLCAGEEIIFLATTAPLLLSDNHNRGVFLASCVSPYLTVNSDMHCGYTC
jgi:hypothetical protein